MDRPNDDNSVTERILRCGRRVVVLRGPAASGKTAAAMEMYERFEDSPGRARCLLLTPNAPAAAALRRRLLAASASGVLISPQVATFAALGGRILAAAGKAGRTLNSLQRRLLLRRIVDELVAAGALNTLGRVADTAGLIVSLDRAIAELKRAAVEPDALARAVGRAGGKSRELLEVYRRYQQALLESGSYDIEGKMWQARQVLADLPASDEPPPGLEGISAVAADGFIDFTPTQLEILRLLSNRLERLVITLPFAHDGRDRMWHWTNKTLERLGEAFGEELEEIEMSPCESQIRPLWEKLFDIDAGSGRLPSRLTLIAAAGADGEVAAVGRRIKRMLLKGAAPGSIAVLARSMAAYRTLIERTFAESDIPVVAAPQRLTDMSLVRFLLDVAEMAPDFAFRDVLRVIGSSYFRPQALGPYGPAEVAAAQMLIREGNVLAGREAYSEAAGRLAQRARRRCEEAQEDLPLGSIGVSPESLAPAAEMLQKLFDLAEAASGTEGFGKLIDALELRAAACEARPVKEIARDLRALAELEAALADVADSKLPAAYLREALAAVSCPAARGESVVDALDVLDARALRYDHVFLLGLSEREFPPKFAESSLIGEADRQAWRRKGVELYSRGDLTAREMLLFYLAISRANGTLTVSFLETDASGAARGPSSFLLSMLEAFGGLAEADRCGQIQRILPGSFAPPADEIASPRDAFNAAMAGLFDPRIADSAAALAWAASQTPEKIHRCAMGLFARHRRYLPDQCDRFDGRITEPQLLKRLADRFPKKNIFSASQLNAYGQCPWQFFGAQILKLQPLTEPQRRLEAVARGLFVHDVLFRVMSRLRDETGGPFRLTDVEEAHLLDVLDEAVEGEASKVEASRPPYPALWEIQKRQMHRELRGYLLAQRGGAAEVEHLHFELGFGVEEIAPEALDPSSQVEPVKLDTPAGAIRIRGKIDRVDRVAGGEGLLVIDYKTGRLPAHADINAGRNLQLPIYSEAIERILSQPSLGGVFHHVADNAELHFSALKPPRGSTAAFEQRRQAAMAKISEFVRGMAAGRFDVTPTHNCPSYCPFRQICHYSPARAVFKAPAGRTRSEGQG